MAVLFGQPLGPRTRSRSATGLSIRGILVVWVRNRTFGRLLKSFQSRRAAIILALSSSSDALCAVLAAVDNFGDAGGVDATEMN